MLLQGLAGTILIEALHIVPQKIQSSGEGHGSEDGPQPKDSGPKSPCQTSLLNQKVSSLAVGLYGPLSETRVLV